MRRDAGRSYRPSEHPPAAECRPRQGDLQLIAIANRYAAITAALAVTLCGFCTTTCAQGFPDRPVHILVGFAPGGAKKSVFDSQWQRTYEDDPAMAEREAAALRKAEAIKSNLMPLYNKGPIQLQTNLANLKDGNGRGRT